VDKYSTTISMPLRTDHHLTYFRKLDILEELNGFEIKGFSFCHPEGLDEETKSQIRIGALQNAIVEPASSPVHIQRDALLELGRVAVCTAAKLGVKMFCFQEIWSK
jgi:hypothetical protein